MELHIAHPKTICQRLGHSYQHVWILIASREFTSLIAIQKRLKVCFWSEMGASEFKVGNEWKWVYPFPPVLDIKPTSTRF